MRYIGQILEMYLLKCALKCAWTHTIEMCTNAYNRNVHWNVHERIQLKCAWTHTIEMCTEMCTNAYNWTVHERIQLKCTLKCARTHTIEMCTEVCMNAYNWNVHERIQKFRTAFNTCRTWGEASDVLHECAPARVHLYVQIYTHLYIYIFKN